VIVALAFAAVTAMLYTVPDVALQHWYLFNMPLVIAAFVFGLRGALVGAIVAVVSLTLLYFSSLSVNQQLSAAFAPLLEVADAPLSGGDISTLVDRAAALGANDPRNAATRAAGGLAALILTNLLFGWMADHGRRQERLALERASGQLKRYFSPQLVHSVLSGDHSMGLATVRKEITVLFADLRGFTALTERLEPEELGTLLNQYLGEMTEVLFKYDGTLDKYIGDAVMAFFGDPVVHGDDPERAVRAAVEMRERFMQLRSNWTRGTRGRQCRHRSEHWLRHGGEHRLDGADGVHRDRQRGKRRRSPGRRRRAWTDPGHAADAGQRPPPGGMAQPGAD
jgi:hypothetical protein